MTIAIIGATGKSGSHILAEAHQRGLDCVAIVRRPERLDREVPYIQRDVFAITRQDLEPFEVIISAFGNEDKTNHQQHVDVIRHYKAILKDSDKRLITVGAAGHLYLDDARTKKLYDEPWMIENGIRPGSLILEQAYLELSQSQGFSWTYFAPAVQYIYNGERSGQYRIATDVILSDEQGKSQISYADYALALVDEIENRRYLNSICTVASV